MTAYGDLAAHFTSDEVAQQLYNKIRAEAFREAAAAISADDACARPAHREYYAAMLLGLAGEKTTAHAAPVEPLCTCGHGASSHKSLRTYDGTGCVGCPANDDRAWLHIFTPTASSEEKTTATTAAAVTPGPENVAGLLAVDYGAGGDYQRAAVIRDRVDALLAHIRSHPDRAWTTSAVHAFYASRAPKRATARRDLETLHCLGWLTLHDDEGRRSYRYTTRKGGRS